MIPASFAGSLSLLSTFPSFAHYLFKKPLYYDDLIDKYTRDPHHAKRYQRVFSIVNIILSAILVTMVVYYAVQRIRWAEIAASLDVSHGISLSWFETLGVVGGVVGIYRKWQMILGRCLIKLLYKCLPKKSQSQEHLPETTITNQ